MKKTTVLFSTVLSFCLINARADIQFLSGVTLANGGEVISFSGSNQLLSTNSLSGISHAIQAYNLQANGTLTTSFSVNLNSVFGSAAAAASVSSVYADSRGFGVATVIPTANTVGSFGRIALFDTSTGSILQTLDVGYHPDHVGITPDGTKLLIANEGEFVSLAADVTFAKPGSVSVVDISSVTAGNFAASIPALTAANVSTYDFTSHLATGVTLTGVRNPRLDTISVRTPNAADVEPEYITASNTQAFITLQENNAIATLDLTGTNAGKYSAINNLGTITKLIDASDRDPNNGGTSAVFVNDSVAGMPMPDTIVSFTRSGTMYLATANEGDERPDNGDRGRARNEAGVDTVNDGGGDQFFSGNITDSGGIGRLNISRIDGNTDTDSGIEVPTAFGTRSFSIYDSATGVRVFDSGSMIEEYVRDYDIGTFNLDVEDNGGINQLDKRSDNKGPEPEALAFGSIDGRDFLFLGAERQQGIFQFDITDFGNISIVGYFNTYSSNLDSGGDFIAPETMRFISAADNVTGLNLLVVGYEGAPAAFPAAFGGSIAVYSLTVPEPGSLALVGMGALMAFGVRRRRK